MIIMIIIYSPKCKIHAASVQREVVGGSLEYLTRFNKIAIQDKGPDGKWPRKPLAYRESNIDQCVITCPASDST